METSPNYEKMRQRIKGPKFLEAHKRFKIGDPISDEELDWLLSHYTILEMHLFVQGERYHFAWRDAYDQKERLENFKKARQQKY